jgi:hypothetical protein
MVTIEGLSVKGSAGYQYLAVDVINPLFVQKQ